MTCPVCPVGWIGEIMDKKYTILDNQKNPSEKKEKEGKRDGRPKSDGKGDN